jgi:hypothetical protein
MKDCDDRERLAPRVVRIDAPELQRSFREVLARVADAGPLGEFSNSVVDCVPNANRCGLAFARQVVKNLEKRPLR